MPIKRSHGRLHAEPPRASDIRGLPKTPTTATSGADRDPRTGRFKPGNTASRRRAIKRIGRQLPWLREEDLEPWARGYLTSAREHALSLLADVADAGPMLTPLAEELATARLVYRGLLQLGLSGDQAALKEARGWLRESRQHLITLMAALGEQAKDSAADDDPLSWVTAEGEG